MPYPSNPSAGIPTVATDANYSDVGQPWDGQPTKVAPTVAVQTQGFKPSALLSGDIIGYLFNTVSAWLTYAKNAGEFLRDNYIPGLPSSVDNEIPRFDGTTGKLIQGSDLTINDSGDLVYKSAKARSVFLPLMDAICYDSGTGAPATITSVLGGALDLRYLSVPGATITAFPVRLRTGCVITSVDIVFDPGTSATARLRKRAPDMATPNFGSLTEIGNVANSGTALQVRTIGSLSETVNAATEITWLDIESSGTNLIYHIRVNFNDPGPRNN